MDAHFRAEYTPRHTTILDCQRHAARYFRPPNRRYRTPLFLGLPAVVASVGSDILVNAILREKLTAFLGPSIMEAISPLTMTLVLIAIFAVWLRSGINRRIRWLESEFPYAPMLFTATDNRLKWESEHSGAWLDYSKIDRLFATPDMVGVIYDGTIVPVPRNAFADETEFAAFLQFVLARVSDQARKKSLENKGVRDLMATGSASREDRR